MTTDNARLKKLKLRAWRRGFREADLILGPFADTHVDSFSDAELDWFEGLLDQPDQDVWTWLLGHVEPPAPYDGELMTRLRAFRDEVYAQGSDRGG